MRWFWGLILCILGTFLLSGWCLEGDPGTQSSSVAGDGMSDASEIVSSGGGGGGRGKKKRRGGGKSKAKARPRIRVKVTTVEPVRAHMLARTQLYIHITMQITHHSIL